VTELTKNEAREEALRRWNALPEPDRATIEQAQVFAAALADELDFRTMANKRRIIFSWLSRDLAGLPAWGNIPPEGMSPPTEPQQV
jgi:uncharacterized protein (DUF2336 family)